MYKKCKVLLLTTIKFDFNVNNNLPWLNDYHLYIISYEPIERGWSGIAYKKDVKGKIFKHHYTTNTWYDDAREVIASTDISLNLPRPSNEFIKKYFNVGKFDDVTVKYKGYLPEVSSDNIITINY